jgi:hypothetical protein
MPATLADTVRIPARVAAQRVRDEMAVLDADTGVYFGLDDVGARMWELLAEHGGLQRVAEILDAEYEADPARLRADLLRLVDDLSAAGLIEIA